MTRTKWMQWTLLLTVLALLVGCASGGGGSAAPAGPSDTELINNLVVEAMTALKSKDIDGMVAAYSDDFSSDNGDKADTIAFLQGAADQGFLDGVEVDTSGIEVAVDGDTATAGPVGLEGAFGAMTLGFDLAKRDGRWWVVSQTQSQ